MKKDIGLALDAAKQAHAELPLGNKTFNLYEQLSKQQLGGKDFSVVYDALKKNLVK
jgi:3-hydroxyisobutyrate dehydrogenase-like beta-hydroxyacid dehydrogenase